MAVDYEAPISMMSGLIDDLTAYSRSLSEVLDQSRVENVRMETSWTGGAGEARAEEHQKWLTNAADVRANIEARVQHLTTAKTAYLKAYDTNRSMFGADGAL
ncbi:hypothetical protein FK529_00605 [Tsukamurella asaccharolytica]|uniref:WXG100 family type VII secretion target n=1 Tax=Tsukamurella asaccharolytica TaxID=2592067 RepID=A0A5C5RFJ3_9ACTN|nr:hypothetical protein [Tsukamurella asaccharolytica]TWS21153.1 hypothetical protein FK529_00605 [Tsukamurella asaccharolytica]